MLPAMEPITIFFKESRVAKLHFSTWDSRWHQSVRDQIGYLYSPTQTRKHLISRFATCDNYINLGSNASRTSKPYSLHGVFICSLPTVMDGVCKKYSRVTLL